MVTADAHQRDEYVYPRADLWIVALDGATKRLTDDGFHHSSPAFSPDGNRIAFRRVKGLTLVIEAQQHQGAPVDLFTMDLASRELTNVTAEWELRPGAPQFDADGRHLYFEAGVSGNNHLFSRRHRWRIGDPGERRRPTPLRFLVLGRLWLAAFVGDDPGRPAEIFVSRLDGSEERLSRLNDAWLDEVDLAPVERLRYPSKDGTEIEGWYLPPRDVTDEPYPLILAIHGGPHGAYGNRFMFQFQLWAANGYGVVFTNPRGSSGYGEDFLYATWGGWGLKDSEDVLAGVDHLVASYAIDTSRIGVTGYSYGGFLTNWILGHETRFAAAIAGAGISNWVSDYATADIPRTKESEFYGPPWEEESGALLRRLSPITYVGNVRTPTLFTMARATIGFPSSRASRCMSRSRSKRCRRGSSATPDSYHGGWAPWDMVHRYYHELRWWEQYLGRRAVTSESP